LSQLRNPRLRAIASIPRTSQPPGDNEAHPEPNVLGPGRFIDRGFPPPRHLRRLIIAGARFPYPRSPSRALLIDRRIFRPIYSFLLCPSCQARVCLPPSRFGRRIAREAPCSLNLFRLLVLLLCSRERFRRAAVVTYSPRIIGTSLGNNVPPIIPALL
jgi:hypothetical protein